MKEELKDIFEELGHSPDIIEMLDSLINCKNSIKNVYQFILELEMPMLEYLEKCRTFFHDGIINRSRNRFFYIKDELKKAIERGKENYRCKDVLYTPNYIV